jgi:hypothetical protein
MNIFSTPKPSHPAPQEPPLQCTDLRSPADRQAALDRLCEKYSEFECGWTMNPGVAAYIREVEESGFRLSEIHNTHLLRLTALDPTGRIEI